MSKIDLHLGDCLEVMKSIPDKSIDMILCDLPYGVTQNKKDIPIDLTLLWKEYNRIIKDKGVIALFSQGLFFVDLVNSNRSMYRYDLVWDKVLVTGFLNAKRMPLRSHEQIAIFYKKLGTYNPQFTIGKPLHGKGNKYKFKEIKNNNYGKFTMNNDSRKGSTQKYPKSIITYEKPHPSVTEHPTQKPVSLLQYLIRTYTNDGDTVLDNCMGSGSTGVACKLLNRDFIGIELNEEYFEIAKNKIEKTQIPNNLWGI